MKEVCNENAGVAHLVFHLRTARRTAKVAAVAEALSLLRGLNPSAPRGGALSEQGGVFWVDVPANLLEVSRALFPRLGYSTVVDLLEPINAGSRSQRGHVRWRGRDYRLNRIYEEDSAAIRETAPDRRVFILPTSDSQTKLVRGYRGDGGALTRRALPVCDARLLANLVRPLNTGETFLDPFAGIGGLLLEANASGYRVLSLDRDSRLRFGLSATGANHHVGDACLLPFRGGAIAAIATELPFDQAAAGLLGTALEQMHWVLKPGGRISIMCAAWQQAELQAIGVQLGLVKLVESTVNRKGTACAVLAWEKNGI